MVTISMLLGLSWSVQAASRPVVSLYTEKGRLIKRLQLEDNGNLRLPSCPNTRKQTFLGWAVKKGGKLKYRAGDYVKIRKNTKLYQVMFKWETEEDIQYEEMPRLSDVYSEVIFVGDSRTMGLQKTLYSEFGADAFPEVKFIARSSTRLSWLKETGYPELQAEIARVRKNDSRPVAVIFNHGVNDLKHPAGDAFSSIRLARSVASYMNWIAPKLERNGCRLFYMSVNPFNSRALLKKGMRSEEELFRFNSELKKRLKGNYTFIDTCSRLYKNGYTTYREEKRGDDGLHYNGRTYKRIYSMCINRINKEAGLFSSGSEEKLAAVS